MISIGMIGTDGTHTESYAKLMNLPGAPLAGRAKVVKMWGEDAAQTQEKATQYNIPQVVGSPEETIQGVDLVMICNRYGDDHPAPARLALQAGVPTFVDKPFANDFSEVRALAQLATETGTPIMSCSALRYAPPVLEMAPRLPSFGTLNCAVASGPSAGDFPNPRAKHPYFYGVHTVELLHTLLGPGAEAVTTQRTSRCDIGLVQYADGRQGTINLLPKSPTLYHGAVYGEQGWGQVDIGEASDFYVGTLANIITMAETGKSPLPLTSTVEVMSILTALIRSAENDGHTIWLKDLE
jgi:predicted dehydrogenase